MRTKKNVSFRKQVEFQAIKSSESIQYDELEDQNEDFNYLLDNNNMTKSICPNLNYSNQFQCQLCNNQSMDDCIICKGQKKINQKRFLLFVQSIFDFKLGKTKKEINNQNSFNGDEEIVIDNHITSMTMRPRISTMYQNKINFNQSSMLLPCQLANKSLNIEDTSSYVEFQHPGIQCDQCALYPIKGKRFKCGVCPDFDYCKKCYQNNNHEHNEWKIMQAPLRKQRDTMHNIVNNDKKRMSRLSTGGLIAAKSSLT